MTGTNKSDGGRDLEKERQELLYSIGENMPEGMYDRIRAAIDAVAVSNKYEIVSSRKGTFNANN